MIGAWSLAVQVYGQLGFKMETQRSALFSHDTSVWNIFMYGTDVRDVDHAAGVVQEVSKK